ncbi:MAG: T9SS type A sorting domain-containing protein [Bacteroidales bacterium]|nr:T9SS type A sorting domain-containing protein [Bacteroidales bacterium]
MNVLISNLSLKKVSFFSMFIFCVTIHLNAQNIKEEKENKALFRIDIGEDRSVKIYDIDGNLIDNSKVKNLKYFEEIPQQRENLSYEKNTTKEKPLPCFEESKQNIDLKPFKEKEKETLFQHTKKTINSIDTKDALKKQYERDVEMARLIEARRFTFQNEKTFHNKIRKVTTEEDSDDDGMPDSWETDNGLNPNDPFDAWEDPDGDFVLNLFEYQLNSNPFNASTPNIVTVSAGGNIEDAIDETPTGSVLRVERGTYNVNYMTFSPTTIMIQGGWNSNFTSRDPIETPTIFDGQSLDEVLYFGFASGTNSVILDGLNLINGKGYFGALNMIADGTAIMKWSIMNCLILDSECIDNDYGGVVYLLHWENSQSDVFIIKSIIANNQSSGIYNQTVDYALGKWKIINSNITNNNSLDADEGYGIDAFTLDSAALTIKFKNTILWGNQKTDLEILWSITANVEYSDIGTVNAAYGAVYNEGSGIINMNPLFVNLDNCNFNLLSGSPCIDAGIEVGLPFLGNYPDIGVFEYSESDLSNLFLYTGTGSINTYNCNTTTHVLNVTNSVANDGDASAGSFRTGWYLSENTTLTTDDYLVATATQSSLPIGYYVNISVNVDLDDVSYLPAGTYYIFVYIDDLDAVIESNEADNLAYFIDQIYYSVSDNHYGNAPDLNWAGQFGGSDVDTSYGYVIGMVADNFANVYTYGYTSNTTDYFGESVNKGIFICKQNGSGNVIWLKQFADIKMAYGSQGNFINIDKLTSHIYITGELYDELIIPGETTLTPEEGGSIFILKYDLDGNYVWSVQEDFPGEEPSVVPDNSGNVIVSGVFRNSITIGTTELISAGERDGFIAKYNSEGNFLWAIRAGGEDIEYMAMTSTDASDNIYVTGEFISENVTIDDAEITLSEGDGNIFLAKLNPNGNVQWITSHASSPAGNDSKCWPTSIKTNPQGYSYIKGWHGDNVYFDDILLISPYPYPGWSYFIAKFDPNGNAIWANSINEEYYGFDYNQMDIDNEGNVYFGAQITGTIHFEDNFDYVNAGDCDLFVAKYTTTGELDWVKTMQGNGTSNNWISSVTVYGTENVFVGGFFGNYISIDDEELTSTKRHGFVTMFGDDINGVKEVYNRNNKEFNVYPNPSNGLVTFTSSFELINKIEILNVTGQIVHTVNIISENQQIDLSNLTKGLYLIKVRSDKYFKTEKLVIK